MVFQDPYDGFSLRRARSEELGDVLAEGLATLLDGGVRGGVRAGDFDYWISVLRDRRRMVGELADKVRKEMSGQGAEAARPLGTMLNALKEVEYLHRRLQPERDVWARRLQNYVPVWRDDLESWSKQMVQAEGIDPRELLGSDIWFSRPNGDLARVLGEHRVLP